ncbi:MAG: hypothetical protein ACRDV2_13575, partial [Actinomycetes bacterium]
MRRWVPERESGFDVSPIGPGAYALTPAVGEAAMVARATVEPVRLETLQRIGEVDPGSLDHDARVDLIVVLERAAARVAGLQARALAAVVEATEEVGLDGEAARHEVGAALRLSPHTAYGRTRT